MDKTNEKKTHNTTGNHDNNKHNVHDKEKGHSCNTKKM